MPLIDRLRKLNLNDRDSLISFLKNKENYKELSLQEIEPEVEEGNRLVASITDGERFKYNGENPQNPFYAEDCIIHFNGELKLKGFDRVKISNTIIVGNLFIWMLPEGCRQPKTSILLENVVVLGNVRIKMFPGYVETVYLGACLIDELSVDGDARCDKFQLDESAVGKISFDDVRVQDLEISDSEIEAFRIIDDARFARKRLSNSKINLKSTFDLESEKFRWKVLPRYPYGENYAETTQVYKTEEKERMFKETYDFLTTFSAGMSLNDLATIENIKLFHDNKKTDAWIHKGLDFLLTPKKILGSVFIVVFACALFYTGKTFYFSGSLDNAEITMSFWHALYYSCITFTTIGYGDYTSCCALVRWVSGIEGLLGVLGGGAFLIALTRTYLDPNHK